eukprot:CAMPEP_0196658290 /NCGR_PEP_ID=MMETSP1086-20130531/28810_1 /TAXON_ID=77921 /ORGANISM="Cyanoptyche  gloeocystis , Strain SAG4.97" /LENGTH=67 /DNA_ID=CAMNT_0041991797 /DNA_START=109 /DNA_END=312 /DNA_ORIENTATION=-
MTDLKTSWPELVGKSGEEAAAAIKDSNSALQVHVVQEGSPCTMDWREDRVRIFVDASGKVASPPTCG